MIRATIAFCLASPAFAQTASSNMSVSATVIKVCIVSAGTLDFGNYNASSMSANTSTATIAVTCTNSTTYEVALDAGGGSGGTTTTRRLSAGGDTLQYQLFRDSGYSQNWGNTSGSDVAAGAGTGAAINLTVYGRIAAGQYRTPGAYTDTVTVTVTY
jgi:spore coat protein U-like protein